MPKYVAVFCARSDGVQSVTISNGGVEENGPTADQLSKEIKKDKSGSCYDYYRELQPSDAKHIDWRLKLGAMWARERGDEVMKKNALDYILAAFPENYRLYEHIKTRTEESRASKPKTHAGGGHDRQDAYLYGHPEGRKKRYRSPAEFFHHLLYLTDDTAKDWQDCSCKFCAPEEIQSKKPKSPLPAAAAPVANVAQYSTGIATESIPKAPPQQISNLSAVPRPPSQPSSQPQMHAPSQAQHPPSQPQHISPAQPMQQRPFRWLPPTGARILSEQKPDVYNIYQNLMMNRYDEANRYHAMTLITNTVDGLQQMGFDMYPPTAQPDMNELIDYTGNQ